MRIVVIGGTGLIGAQVVRILRNQGHEAVSAARSTGVDTFSGEGLADALTGAQVLVDVTESSWREDWAVLDFFVTSTRNLLEAEIRAGVGHHVALSVVGVDRIQDSGYFRAKAAQEDLVRNSSIPYTIVRSTQFFDFMDTIIQAGSEGEEIHVSPTMVKPVAPDDVAETLAEIAAGAPVNGTIELAGSEAICLHELARLILAGHEDSRRVIVDPQARFFGAKLGTRSLLPGPNPRIGPSTVRDWLRHFITAD